MKIVISELVKEINRCVNENKNLEFIIDINNINYWELDLNNGCIIINELCVIYLFKKKDDKYDNYFILNGVHYYLYF